MIDRSIPPKAHAIESIEMIEPGYRVLPNNVPVYELSAGTQEVVKLELIFNAGSSHHDNPLIPAFTGSMLREGTSGKTAREIASAIDDYGAFLEMDHDKDFSGVTLFTLNRYLPQTLPVVLEVITQPVFPEKEWEILRSNRLDKYRINQGKVSFVAGKRFQELLFRNSLYGTPFDEASYTGVSRGDLHDFWKQHFNLPDARIFISGKITDEMRSVVSEVLGSTPAADPVFDKPLRRSGEQESVDREQFIPREDAIQSAIRIGRRLFTKNHPDFFGMKVLTTILGGYFGSRLMSNIREDKGYTYGIGAGTASYKDDGYFYISTEVGTDVCSAALTEIYREIEILQQELVPEAELNLVRNYMLGNLLKSFDGPMERMDRFKSTHLFGLDLTFYKHYADTIRTAEPEHLRELARKWLRREDLLELVVGRK